MGDLRLSTNLLGDGSIEVNGEVYVLQSKFDKVYERAQAFEEAFELQSKRTDVLLNALNEINRMIQEHDHT